MQQMAYLWFKGLCLLPLASAFAVLLTPERWPGLRGGSRDGGATSLVQKLPQSSTLGSEVGGHHTSEVGVRKKATLLSTYDPLYFGLVIDAGSTGTRVRMFRWTLRTKVDLMEVVPLDSDEDQFEVTPGLDSYADDPKAALPALGRILKATQGYVPKAVWDESLLYLKATAGMRLLERSKAENLMDVVRDFLASPDNCPYKFVSAEILSGEQEAVFSFLTANYNLGTLSSPPKTAGALELGGASMQVVFRPTDDIQDNEFQFYLQGQLQSVYAKSYMRFGIDEALKRMMVILISRNPDNTEVESPCHNPGFKDEFPSVGGTNYSVVGTGKSAECAKVVRKLMGLDMECLLPPCAIFGSYMAPLQGEFRAFAGYFYAVHGLGLVGWKDSKELKLDDISEATDAYCAKDLAYAQKESGQQMKFAKQNCFTGTYVHQTLLALGFQDSKSRVIFSRKLAGFNLGWPAGAMLYETQLNPRSLNPSEGIRVLCGSPAEFGTPPKSVAVVKSPLAMMSIAIAALFFEQFS